MIFYGTNSSRLKNGQINNVTCPNCNNQTSMTYSVFGKYAYLYWIPVFPVGKVNVLECNACKRTYKLKELSSQIQEKFEREKHTGIPFLHFSGLAIIFFIIGFIWYLGSKDDEQDLVYINAPEVGDVYSLKSSITGNYTSMKVTRIDDDSIYAILNDYEIDKRSRIDEIDKVENYTMEAFGYTRQELKELFDEETIYEIDRD